MNRYLMIICSILTLVSFPGRLSGQVTYKLDGLNFSPYLDGQSPDQNISISAAQIQQRMAIVAPYTNWVRTFGCLNGLGQSGQIAHSMGLKVAIGVWIGPNSTANAAEIACAVGVATSGQADMVIVGTEVLRRDDVTPAQLVAYMATVRQQIPSNVQVTTADIYGELLGAPEVMHASDVILANIYPYWQAVPVDAAINALASAYQLLVSAASGKTVIIAETGWPSGGNPVGPATPSPTNSASYFVDFVSWARANNVPYFYFNAFDETWKTQEEGPQGAFWGLWNSVGILKPGMQSVFNGVPAPGPGAGTCGGPGTPSIDLTFVGPYNDTRNVHGRVTHVIPTGYKVAVYIFVGGGWWTKPTFANPLTNVQPDCTFSTPIVTGGIDAQATRVQAYLLPNGYTPPALGGQATFPPELAQNSLDSTEAVRGAHSICGAVSANASPLPNVTVLLTGSATLSGQTVTTGQYCFSDLAAGGTYSVAVSKQGYSASPPSQVPNLNGAVTRDFSAYPQNSRDLDGNGKPDVLWRHTNGTVAVWYMGGADGSVYLGGKGLAGASAVWQVIGAADFDGNGKPDFLWRHTNGTIVVWYMGGVDGSVYLSGKALAGSSAVWRVVAAADLDGNGKPDLLWQHTNGTVAVWYMGGADGSVYQSAKALAGSSAVWRVIGAADLDGNGKPDLLWKHTDGTVVVWYMGGTDGSVYQSGKMLAGASPVWQVAATVDLDGNGKPDLLWQHTDGTVAVWYMGGADGSVYQSGKAIAGASPLWRVVSPW